MTLFEKIRWYRKHYGTMGLFAKGIRVLAGERKVRDPSIAAVEAKAAVPGADALIAARFFRQRPLRAFPAQRKLREVVLVTDSVSRGSLFGGVATAILLAAVVAREAGMGLRVLCRQERANEKSIQSILGLHRIELANPIRFAFLNSYETLQETDIDPGDIIITTSWWTTESVVNGLGSRNLFYLLQEDERMFYPYDDDHLRCSTLLARKDIKVIVNSELLHSHLLASDLPGFAERSIWFEPAFTHAVTALPPEPRERSKRNFFFYARPNHPRNLFYRGLEVMQACVQRGILDPAEWQFLFVGSDIPDLTLADGVSIERHEALSWAEYTSLIARVELGLSLMYTPHPSYPPLDLAAAGAVAVTNTFGVKTDLSRYCENIICADLDVDSLVDAVARGVALSRDRDRRASNLRNSRLQRDWANSLAPVAAHILRS
jgi:hypothetical protein